MVVEGGGGVSKKFYSQKLSGIHPIYATSDRSQNELTVAPPTEDVQGYLAIASSCWLLSREISRRNCF